MSVTTVSDTVNVVDEAGDPDTYSATIAYESNDATMWTQHYANGLSDLGDHGDDFESEGAYLQANPDTSLLSYLTMLGELGGTVSTDGFLMDFFNPGAYANNLLKTTHSLSSVTTITVVAAYSENPPENPTGVNSNQTANDRVEAIGERLQVIGARVNVIKNNLANSYYVTQLFKNFYYLVTNEVGNLRNEVRALEKELAWIHANYPNR